MSTKNGGGNRNKPPFKNGGNKPVGKEADLKHHLFVLGSTRDTEVFHTTRKEVAELAGKRFGKPLMNLVNGKESPPKKPDPPAGLKPDEVSFASKLYDKEVDLYVKEKSKYKDYTDKVFLMIMGNTNDVMRNAVESSTKWKELDDKSDVIGLLELMKDLTHSKKNTQYEHWSLVNSMHKLFMINQSPTESLPKYYDRFTSLRDVNESAWGLIVPPKLAAKASTEAERAKVHAAFQACLFMRGLDRARYGHVLDEYNSNYIDNHDDYPKTVEDAMERLANKAKPGTKTKTPESEDYMVVEKSFFQKLKKQSTQSNQVKNLTCPKCGGTGHKPEDCATESDDDSTIESLSARTSFGSTRSKKGKKKLKKYTGPPFCG